MTQILLFDLGGVLVDWAGAEGLRRLVAGVLDHEQARAFWIHAPWVRRLETGQCTPLEFATGMVELLGLPISPAVFLQEFLSWDRGLMEGAVALLDELRPRYTLACLTNNNAAHWEVLTQRHGIPGLFDHCFSSHEIGLMKPDAAVYEYVVSRLGCRADQILFLDDNPECTAGAEAVGIPSACVKGVAEVRALLVERGLL